MARKNSWLDGLMTGKNSWALSWPGTFKPRKVEGHYCKYDRPTVMWSGAAVVWVMEHARDARAARTMARIVTSVPYFVKDEDSGPNGETITQFSYRQMADMTGCSRDSIARNVPRLCVAGGPLEYFWKPEQGNSSRGTAYLLRNVENQPHGNVGNSSSSTENLSPSTGNSSSSTDSVSESPSTGERPPVLESTGVSSTGERPPVLTEGQTTVSTSTSISSIGRANNEKPSSQESARVPTYKQWAAIADRLEAGEYESLTASEREDYTRGRPAWNERYVYERKGVAISKVVNQ